MCGRLIRSSVEGCVMKQVQRDFPLDFTTQKYWYNEQIVARERMK